MFGPLLLGRFRPNWHQTWQEGQDPVRKGALAIGFHGNQTVVMVFNKSCPVPLLLGLWSRSLVC